MPNQDSIEFTDREKFIVSYYRSELSHSRPALFWDVAIVTISMACVAMFVIKHEIAYGFVGYALVLGRLGHLAFEGSRWSRDYRSIFTKYDAKLRELTDGPRAT